LEGRKKMDKNKINEIIESFERKCDGSSTERQIEGLQFLIHNCNPMLTYYNERRFFVACEKYAKSRQLSKEEIYRVLLIPKMIIATLFNADELFAMCLTDEKEFIKVVLEEYNILNSEDFAHFGKIQEQEMIREAVVTAAISFIK
jgi:hypothetical protein